MPRTEGRGQPSATFHRNQLSGSQSVAAHACINIYIYIQTCCRTHITDIASSHNHKQNCTAISNFALSSLSYLLCVLPLVCRSQFFPGAAIGMKRQVSEAGVKSAQSSSHMVKTSVLFKPHHDEPCRNYTSFKLGKLRVVWPI